VVYLIKEDGSKERFSKGILSKDLEMIGIRLIRAYDIAEAVEEKLLRNNISEISWKKLVEFVCNYLSEKEKDIYITYLKFRRSPKIILIGGGTGVGTSTTSVELANRLKISSVVGTDSIREVMRKIISKEISPALHESTYTAWKSLRYDISDRKDKVIIGYRRSVEPVLVGVEAVIDRALKENTDIIIEGVHILPSLIKEEYLKNENTYFVFLGVKNEGEHKKRFYLREKQSSRKAEKYLKHFKEIREIHDYIIRDAKKHNFSIIYTSNVRENTNKCLMCLLEEYKKRDQSIK
jgi:2-phosphoglycerate kinase